MSVTNELFAEVGYTNSKGEEITKDEKEKEILQLKKQKEESEKQSLRASMENYVKTQESFSTNYFFGFLGALAGALLISIPWAFIESTGYFAAFFAFIAIAVSGKFYNMTKTKSTNAKAVCVLFATLIANIFEQIVSNFFEYVFFSSASKLSGFSKAISLYFKNFSDVLEFNIENLIIGVIFTFIGSFVCLRNIMKTKHNIALYKEIDLQ